MGSSGSTFLLKKQPVWEKQSSATYSTEIVYKLETLRRISSSIVPDCFEKRKEMIWVKQRGKESSSY